MKLVNDYRGAVAGDNPPNSQLSWCESADLDRDLLARYVHANGDLTPAGEHLSDTVLNNKKSTRVDAKILEAWEKSTQTLVDFAKNNNLSLPSLKAIVRIDHSLRPEGRAVVLKGNGHQFKKILTSHIYKYIKVAGIKTLGRFCEDENLDFSKFRHLIHSDGTLPLPGAKFMTRKVQADEVVSPGEDETCSQRILDLAESLKNEVMPFDFDCDLADCDLEALALQPQ